MDPNNPSHPSQHQLSGQPPSIPSIPGGFAVPATMASTGAPNGGPQRMGRSVIRTSRDGFFYFCTIFSV